MIVMKKLLLVFVIFIFWSISSLAHAESFNLECGNWYKVKNSKLQKFFDGEEIIRGIYAY